MNPPSEASAPTIPAAVRSLSPAEPAAGVAERAEDGEVRPLLVRRHALAGATSGVILALVDVAVSFRHGPQVGAVFGGMLHALAMYAALGWLFGLLVGSLLRVASRVPRLASTLRLLSEPARFFRADARASAGFFAALLSGGVTFYIVWRLTQYFASAFVNQEATRPLLALSVVVALPVSFGLFVWLSHALRRPMRDLGVIVAPGWLIVVASAAVVGYALLNWDELPEAFHTANHFRIGGYAMVPLTYYMVSVGLRGSSRRWPTLVSRASLPVFSVILAAFILSALTYGSRNRIRGYLEQQTVLGKQAVAVLKGASDRDGDGHSWAFGGGDCDDSDADVHPGAADPVGDGIDSDCFDGDGSRRIQLQTQGMFGALPEGLRRPNIILFSVDALRPDHMGIGGYEHDTTPNMDRFSQRSTRFTRAVSQSSRTLYAVPPMLTGLYPSELSYGTEHVFRSLSPAETHTIAEALDAEGYQTAAVMASDYFVRLPTMFQGFETVRYPEDYKPERTWGIRVLIEELERMAGSSQPFLLWTHHYGVHAPYLHDERPSIFGDEYVHSYDTEVHYADAQFQELLDAVERLEIEDETVVILAADHGEAFGEHGTYWHSTSLYGEELRIPIVVHVPGLDPSIVDEPVGLIDVAATVLNVAGIEPARPISGRSLLPFMTGERDPDPERILIAEYMPDGVYTQNMKSIQRGDLKLIWWVRDGRHQLFDLSVDPTEQEDISDDRPDDADVLLSTLRAWTAQVSGGEAEGARIIEENRLERAPARMTERLDVRFPGKFTILGYDLPRRTYQAGDTISLRFYYRVDGNMTDSYYFACDFAPAGGGGRVDQRHMFFGAQHYPLYAHYFTNEWQRGEILRDPVDIPIPANLATPLELQLTLRVMRGHRYPLPNADNQSSIDLGTIRIRAAPSNN
ncbi:MAG: sulfatase-like hydrolase/transferase [Myxococcota bacterium]